MTITSATAQWQLSAQATPAGTNVTGPVLVGQPLANKKWTDANIVYSFKVTSAAGGNVATLTVSSGAVAQTTGSPTITDAGTDFEGITLPTLATLYGIYIEETAGKTSSAAADCTIAGTLGFAGVLALIGDVATYTSQTGLPVTSGTVTLTFATTAVSVEVVVIGKTA